MNPNKMSYCVLLFSAIILSVPSASLATYVIPMRGGGQIPNIDAPMIHCDIMFDGTNISLGFNVPEADIPVLRPLTPPDEFNPAEAWSVLQNKDYNWQYAWNPGGTFSPPAGTGVWVERLSQDSGLEVYARPPKFWTAPWPNPWPALFVNDGDRWKWGGTMSHNAYAVFNPTQTHYQATYRVYIGDAVTGEPVSGYGSADVTWTWHVVPDPASLVLLGFGAIGLLVKRRSRKHISFI